MAHSETFNETELVFIKSNLWISFSLYIVNFPVMHLLQHRLQILLMKDSHQFNIVWFVWKLLITFPLLQSQPCQLFGHFMLRVFYRPLPPHFPLCLEIETKWKELLWWNGRCKDYFDEKKTCLLIEFSDEITLRTEFHAFAGREKMVEGGGWPLVSWMAVFAIYLRSYLCLCLYLYLCTCAGGGRLSFV